jgi:hypothetical protein
VADGAAGDFAAGEIRDGLDEHAIEAEKAFWVLLATAEVAHR